MSETPTMTPEKAAALREPFPPEVIGKLPKPTKADNKKGECRECGGWHGLPAVHLDYVGHAAATDRLLSVDPEWTWRPMALDDAGLPLIRNGELWILLTICGVTRPGVGDGKSTKEMIGDAIRNAAMRFGVALDLWAKEDLHAASPEPPPELVTAEQADELRAALNPRPAADRVSFLDRFGVRPGDLPASLYDDAARWIADLEPIEPAPRPAPPVPGGEA